MKTFFTGRNLLLFYFLSLIGTGTLLLLLPVSWKGREELRFIDALFTSTSAVCITGLITVDTALYTRFGQSVILFLIQFGGLGIITFSSFILMIPGLRISFGNRNMIKEFYIDSIEHDPARITRNILLLTIGVETAGTVLLYTQFRGLEDGLFQSLFHAVSAFCNAGFSTFSNNLESWSENRVVLLTIPALIILGGISFVVINDILHVGTGTKKKLTLHSRIVFAMTALLIASGTVFFMWQEKRVLAGFTPGYKLLNALFSAVTPRTAGFNTLVFDQFTEQSKFLTIFLMFTGGAPGSIAGGVKVTTIFLVFLIIFKGMDNNGEIRIGKRKVGSDSLLRTSMLILKALMILIIAVILLLFSESKSIADDTVSVLDIIFETVSAFGTVGLSLGITSLLSAAGKIIIILTMFTGRIGIILLVTNIDRKRVEKLIDYPHEEIMII